jgi:hypothetical protein
MENPGSPVYRVMDRGPRTRSKSREEKKAELLAHFRKNGFVSEKEKQAAATRIQKHFRGMIVRNPTGTPLKEWVVPEENDLNISGQIQEMNEILAEEPKNIYSRWLADPIVPNEEEQQCHPVGWTQKNHYSELGWQWCGQSCPCCRARAGDTLGACPVCLKYLK